VSPLPAAPAHRFALALAIAAAAAPSLLAYNVSPSPTFLNQALALGLWGAWVFVGAAPTSWRGPAPLQAALGLVALAAAWSWLAGALPASLALSAIGALAAAAVLAAGGAGRRSSAARLDLFALFCWAWLVAGLLNVGVAGVQVFLPDLPDGDWIAHSGFPGRAVGNLRQPNHLSSLLLWSCIAVVALFELGRLGRRAAALAGAALVFAVVLTASRTGLVSVLLLALWGLVDRRLSRPARTLLLAAPLLYALSWLAMAQWAALSQHAFGGSQRLAESDISSSRFAIWRDTWALIRMHPWAGVGFGEFNFAWTLTPFPQRPVAFFDHTHNLLLQLAVELGLPLAGVVMALLLWALWRAARQAWTTQADDGTARRAALMMVLMIGLHSLLEYPLWYSYFLLPAAWAFGFALQCPAPASAAPGTGVRAAPGMVLAALAVVLGAAFSVVDYARVAVIFSSSPDAPPLEQRIADGQRSVFFAHHADYAEVTSGVAVRDPVHAFDRAAHYLLDTRFMIAWARSLAERGELDAARTLAARLREFHNADAREFFEPCAPAASAASAAHGTVAPSPASAAQAFQCERPAHAPGWQSFLPHPR
jgi:O-antigen ligase